MDDLERGLDRNEDEKESRNFEVDLLALVGDFAMICDEIPTED